MTAQPHGTNPDHPFRAGPAIGAAALLAIWSVAQGFWTPQNGDAEAIARAATTLSLPDNIEGWISTESEIDRESLAAAGASAGVSRRYRDVASGTTVTAVLICGRPAQVAVHPPTSCYRGLGFVPESEMRSVSVDRSHQFQSAVFRRGDGSRRERVELLWAWSDRGPWRAPASPRITFAGAPVLYKLYVAMDRTDALDRTNETRGRPRLIEFTERLTRSPPDPTGLAPVVK